MSGQLSAEWWIVFILINLFFGDGIRDDKKILYSNNLFDNY